jgi:hypothetical protein
VSQESLNDMTAGVAEIFARDDCPLSGWTGVVHPGGEPPPDALMKLIWGNPAVKSVSASEIEGDLLKGSYYRFDTLLALGVYNIPDDVQRGMIRSVLAGSIVKGGSLYMTVKMSFREGGHRGRFFSEEELIEDFQPRFETVKVHVMHSKWTQLVICRGRKVD